MTSAMPGNAIPASQAIAQPTRLAEVTLSGFVDDGTGNPIKNGKLFITLNAPVIENVGGVSHVRYPMEPTPIDITAGTFTAKLVPSEEVTYNFRLAYIHQITRYLLANGQPWNGAFHLHTDSKYYTGKTHTAQSQLLSEDLFDELRDITNFDAHILPSYGDTVSWAGLVNSGISAKNVDSSVLYLAHLLLTDPVFATTVAQNIVRFKGNYNANDHYRYGDEVMYLGDKWIWLGANGGNSTPAANNTDWVNATGSGNVGASLINTAPDTWDGVIDKAPTAAALFTQLALKAPIASPTFTGDVSVPTITPGVTGHALNDIAFATALQNALRTYAPIASPHLTGNVIVPDVANVAGAAGLAINDKTLATYVTAALGALSPTGVFNPNVAFIAESFPTNDTAPIGGGLVTRNLEFKSWDWLSEIIVNRPNVALPKGKWLLLGLATTSDTNSHRSLIKRTDNNSIISVGLSGRSSTPAENSIDVCFAALNVTAATPVSVILQTWSDGGSPTGGKPANQPGVLETYAGLLVLKLGTNI